MIRAMLLSFGLLCGGWGWCTSDWQCAATLVEAERSPETTYTQLNGDAYGFIGTDIAYGMLFQLRGSVSAQTLLTLSYHSGNTDASLAASWSGLAVTCDDSGMLTAQVRNNSETWVALERYASLACQPNTWHLLTVSVQRSPTPRQLNFYLDGKCFARASVATLFQDKWALNTATLGHGQTAGRDGAFRLGNFLAWRGVPEPASLRPETLGRASGLTPDGLSDAAALRLATALVENGALGIAQYQIQTEHAVKTVVGDAPWSASLAQRVSGALEHLDGGLTLSEPDAEGYVEAHIETRLGILSARHRESDDGFQTICTVGTMAPTRLRAGHLVSVDEQTTKKCYARQEISAECPDVELALPSVARGDAAQRRTLTAMIADGEVAEDGRMMVRPEADRTSLLRNPCSGWAVYDDAGRGLTPGKKYWDEVVTWTDEKGVVRSWDQATCAEQYASIFYIRTTWASIEPERGHYAWAVDESGKPYNQDFLDLIDGAKKRGLKLAFRFYDNAQDTGGLGCPQYVKESSSCYQTNGGPTPYIDDATFQAHWETFIAAFAARFDNPDEVDFIDGFAVGPWGEVNGFYVQYSDAATVTKRLAGIVAKHFKAVPYVYPYSGNRRYEEVILNNPNKPSATFDPTALDAYNYGFDLRRDGLGSVYVSEAEHTFIRNAYGKHLFIGEACWWHNGTMTGASYQTNGTFLPTSAPPSFMALRNWRDVHVATYQDAYDLHANVLDLREAGDARCWVEESPDLVRAFIENGGYRLRPTEVRFPYTLQQGEPFTVTHTWTNDGRGYLPNNMRNWNYKYQPAIALLDPSSGAVVAWELLDGAEPSHWLWREVHTYDHTLTCTQTLPAGTYIVAIGIVDTRNNRNLPGIRLAVKNELLGADPSRHHVGWTPLGTLSVEKF